MYAYCLMTNHVHLVIDPGSQVENLTLLMKRIAGRQTRDINTIENRSSSLWEGRFKSSPIKTPEEQSPKYQQWLSETFPDGEWNLIREATQQGQGRPRNGK